MTRKDTIISKYADNITSAADLLGNAKPSILFYPLANLLGDFVSGDVERMLSKTSMALRRLIHPIIMLLVPAFMDYKQVFESKNALLGIDVLDEPLELPKEPVIWCVNHGFKDDVAASIHATRHSYVIHTVVADPVSMEGLSEKEGLELLRDTMATWYFLLMKKYGQTTRDELLDGFASADDAWESYIAMHTGCVKYYDREIELCADYRPKQIARPEDVWQSVANIRNIHAGNAIHVKYARELVAREKRRDFQRRF